MDGVHTYQCRNVTSVIIILFILSTLVAISSSQAYASDMELNILIGENNIVIEQFNINLTTNRSYRSFEFITTTKPISVAYEGDYSIAEQLNEYHITFYKNITEGTQNIRFSLVYNKVIDRTGNTKIFREGFDFSGMDHVHVNATLPEYHILSREPSAAPSPDAIASDGRSIVLSWEFRNATDVAMLIFYEGNSRNNPMIIISITIVLLLAAGYAWWHHKKRVNNAVREILSENEKALVDIVASGITKQKDIAAKMEFSKSKMSKLIRKLEEKDIIEKTPHFKTNIIHLKKLK